MQYWAIAGSWSLWVLFCVLVGAGFVLTALGVRVRFGGESRKRLVGELVADAGVALLTGAILGVVVFIFEEDRFNRDVRRDNVRFVREVAIQADADADAQGLCISYKPFAGLDLRGAVLHGLDLHCADFSRADLSGAQLDLTILVSAELTAADLHDAILTGVDVTGADLGFADLSGASLRSADLSGADLDAVDLTGADLSGADLTGAEVVGVDMTRVIYDDETHWPDGFTPPDDAIKSD